MQREFPFIGGAYSPRVRSQDNQRCVNLYPEVSAAGPNPSKSPVALIGTPGLVPFATLATGAAAGIRGMIRFSEGWSVVVAGTNVYRVSTTGAAALLGSITPNTTPVSMASNGSSVLIVDGTSTFYEVQQSSPGLPAFFLTLAQTFRADVVDFLDGRFVVNEKGSGRVRASDAYSTAFQALSFATAEGSPDSLVSLIVDHRELWLFGSNTTEVFYNSGASPFPFERNSGAFSETGCAAAFSPAKMNGAVYWLSANDRGRGRVVRSNGYQAAPISTHAVETAIARYARIDDANAHTYQQDGHEFYVLTFPTANATWVYDATTELWHERSYRNPTTGTAERHRARCQMAFAGRVLVGDHTTGALYALSLDAHTDAGAPIARVRQCSYVSNSRSYMRHNALQVDMDAGEGLLEGQGSDPRAVLDWSDDGGEQWSSEHWAAMGRIGARKTRVRWRRLGVARDRLYRLTITDPVPVRISGATIDAVPAAT